MTILIVFRVLEAHLFLLKLRVTLFLKFLDSFIDQFFLVHNGIRLIILREGEVLVSYLLDLLLLRLKAFAWILIMQIDNLSLILNELLFSVSIDVHYQVKFILFAFI